MCSIERISYLSIDGEPEAVSRNKVLRGSSGGQLPAIVTVTAIRVKEAGEDMLRSILSQHQQAHFEG